MREGLFSIFEQDDSGLWLCVFPAYPLLNSFSDEDFENQWMLAGEISKRFGRVYFPLVYKDAHGFFPEDSFLECRREPTSFIVPPYSPDLVTARAIMAFGSQIPRRFRYLQESGSVTRPEDPSLSVDAIATVERSSWKARCSQDMRSRGQLQMYSAMIYSRVAEVIILSINSRPIAFVLTARVGNTVYALKWSYDHDYRRFSPGLYLLAAHLPSSKLSEDGVLIDMFGSPDHLKSALCGSDNLVERSDFGGPKGCPEIEAFLKTRRARDKWLAEQRLSGKGLRKTYACQMECAKNLLF
jgi:hypothetical protein